MKEKKGVEIGDLTYKTNAVVQKRHIILHSNKVVDEDALKVFRQAGLTEFKVGERLTFTAETVGTDIDTIGAFATSIRNLLAGSPRPGTS